MKIPEMFSEEIISFKDVLIHNKDNIEENGNLFSRSSPR